MNAPANLPTVLLVDDTEVNLEVLISALTPECEVSVAKEGETALRAAQTLVPDLVLLDILMPGIDGYEVCRRLKADPRTQEIPIVFLTALTDPCNEEEGLRLGAVDYIRKPFNAALVRARVRNHLALRRAHQELRQQNAHLESLVQKRTRAVVDAHERLRCLDAAKTDLLSAIAHELRTPASGVLAVAELAVNTMPDRKEREIFQGLLKSSRERLLGAIDHALQLAELQAHPARLALQPVDLLEALARVQDQAQVTAAQAGVKLLAPVWRGAPLLVPAVESLLAQALTTLLQALIKLAGRDTSIRTELGRDSGSVLVSLESTGRALPEPALATLFDTFSAARCATYIEELGLAIPLAAKILESLHASTQIQNTPQPGVRLSLRFALPQESP